MEKASKANIISIHASAKEATDIDFNKLKGIKISIHASAKEATGNRTHIV